MYPTNICLLPVKQTFVGIFAVSRPQVIVIGQKLAILDTDKLI